MADVLRILVVVAHPDDAEFGCAGSVARWVADGCEIHYCLFTSGNRGSDDPAMTPELLAAVREAEQRAAAEVLGVKSVTFLHYPDGELEDTRDARRDVVREIRRVRPDRIVTQNPFPSLNPYSGHRDHRHAGRLALDAVYPYARDRMHFPELLAEGFEPHKVRSVYLMQGYYRDPDGSARALRDGWLHTGDLGFLDAEGYLFITGRIKDVIIVRGQNIVPTDVEEAADHVAGVRYSAAVGLESERTGTQRLHVVAEVRGDTVSPEELSRIAQDVAQAVRQRNGLRPARVLLVKPQTIPKTSSGKIQRAALAAMAPADTPKA